VEFEEGNIRITIAIQHEDVTAWTDNIRDYYGEAEVEEREVRAAAQRYIAERGLGEYRTAMQNGLDTLTRERLLEMILATRDQPVDLPVELLPTDDLCSRTDEFCPIVMANKDCRRCQFYLG
jgi:hypothetical protein